MRRRQKQNLSRLLGMALGLFLIWLLLSGKFEVKFLLIGLFSSLAISYVCLPFLTIKKPGSDRTFFLFGVNYLKLFLYCIWLLGEIFKASFGVTVEILKYSMNYEPRIVYFAMPFENPAASVLLANSIILTPGTITLDVTEDGVFQVHALSDKLAEDLLGGEMARRVGRLYGETCSFTPLPQRTVTTIPSVYQEGEE
jgi:multicomponent Na+:H+ antiporter subunit E